MLMSRWRLPLALLGTLAFLVIALYVQSYVADETGELAGRYANEELSVLRDPGGRWHIADVLSPALQTQFQSANRRGVARTEDAEWLRLRLRPQPMQTEQWLVEVEPSTLDDVRFYVADALGKYGSEHKMGDQFPFAERPLAYRTFVFPVSLDSAMEAATERVIYIRVQGRTFMNATVRLWTMSAFLRAAQGELLLFGVFFGLMLAVAVTNILTALLLRERAYWAFAALIVLLAWQQFNSSGLLAQYLFPHTPTIPDRLSALNFCLVTVGLMLVHRRALHLAEHFPRIDALLVPTALALTVLGVVNFFAPSSPMSGFALAVMSCMSLINLWAAWKDYRLSRPGALYWLIGTFAYVTALLFVIWHILGLGPWPHLARAGWRTGISLLVIMMYVGVVRAMRVERLAHLEANAQVRTTQALVAQERQMFNEQTAFFAFVTHELRTPLAVLVSGLANLRNQALGAGQEVQERITRLSAATHRLSALIDRHLRLQRLANIDFSPDVETCTADFAALEALDLMRQAHPHRCIDFHCAEDLPGEVRQDSELIVLALCNLLDNALKYSPASCPVIFTLSVDHAVGELRYAITDQGLGIDLKDQQRLFGLYARVEGNRHVGFGIGLALVERVARHHAGRIECQSTLGKGTTFTLSIPECGKAIESGT